MNSLSMMCGVYYYYIIVYCELSNEHSQFTQSCSPAVSGKFTIFSIGPQSASPQRISKMVAMADLGVSGGPRQRPVWRRGRRRDGGVWPALGPRPGGLLKPGRVRPAPVPAGRSLVPRVRGLAARGTVTFIFFLLFLVEANREVNKNILS